MQYSAIFLSALAATGVIAAPTRRQKNSAIIVSLQSSTTGSQTQFNEGIRQEKKPIASSGPFDQVTLLLDETVEQQDLRCQLLDEQRNPIQLRRNNNIDVTFAKGDPWEFVNEDQTSVSSIICDPDFVKGGPTVESTGSATGDVSITVQLSDGNLATQTQFLHGGAVREEQTPIGSSSVFNSVELRLGADIAEDLRCQILDADMNAILLARGENKDTTFADGDAGKWNFIEKVEKGDGPADYAPRESRVSKIICDPEFKKASA
ncbi:hypothetical protein BS50DRAFT_574383 [Corynespora cassiicola Philippines]|uniref:Uncharacterized protein n=1 Tax=Corynespora cassiicola Philippines TaxID=1448308 RepID=A0A2T2NKG8_CORCC|nr:hypothetical protein BS50DRAFT_574383 [Corynespora cassiicola Philippines]